MTDREMLELAAKAAGIGFNDKQSPTGSIALYRPMEGWWNPLADDGDALRLAVKLRLTVDVLPWGTGVHRWNEPRSDETTEPSCSDPYAATRRAITRAAAEIGKSMEGADG